MDEQALMNISYGLFLLSAREDGRDNACIINTLSQISNKPASPWRSAKRR